jgi:hypothetical protein
MFSDQFNGYGWIKVKKWVDDQSKPLLERFAALETHHVEEATFLVDKVRELAKIIDEKDALLQKLQKKDPWPPREGTPA